MSYLTSKNSPGFKNKVLVERAEILARTIGEKKEKIDSLEIIPFKLDQETFALETQYVKEVYPLKEYTFLPCAPAFVYGLANVRRRIFPIIDLKVLFNIPNDVNAEKKLLILENEEIELAILIDHFNTIRTISKNELQLSLPTLTGIRQDFLKGLIVDGTVILDGQKLMTSLYLALDVNVD